MDWIALDMMQSNPVGMVYNSSAIPIVVVEKSPPAEPVVENNCFFERDRCP